jgi:hypothetical protein
VAHRHGEGYNVNLTLRPDFSYDAVWAGCLGTYGTAKGRWHLDGHKLSFTPTEETGMMRKHLRMLTITSDKQQQVVLVPPKSMHYFKKWGSDPPYWCYVRAR